MQSSFVSCIINYFLDHFKVWIVGSSIIRDAFYRTQARPSGVHLGLDHIGGSVLWDFQPGMKTAHIFTRFSRLLSTHPRPHIAIFHCAGNDIGQTPISQLTNQLKSVFIQMMRQYPEILFIWSGIIPRIEYRHEISHSKLEKCRVRINSCIGKYVIKNGGAYIKHPEIKENNSTLFRDSVHLSDLGSDILLNTLSGGIHTFVTSNKSFYP